MVGGGAGTCRPLSYLGWAWLLIFLDFGAYGMTVEDKMRKLIYKFRIELVYRGENSSHFFGPPLKNLTLRPCNLTTPVQERDCSRNFTFAKAHLFNIGLM